MPELWEQCNPASLAVLIKLYYEVHERKPDFCYDKKVTMSPEVEEDIDIARFMSERPWPRGGE